MPLLTPRQALLRVFSAHGGHVRTHLGSYATAALHLTPFHAAVQVHVDTAAQRFTALLDPPEASELAEQLIRADLLWNLARQDHRRGPRHREPHPPVTGTFTPEQLHALSRWRARPATRTSGQPDGLTVAPQDLSGGLSHHAYLLTVSGMQYELTYTEFHEAALAFTVTTAALSA